MAKKTVKLRPWTATEVYKLEGLAKKKVGAAKIAKALKRTTRAVENKSYLLGVVRHEGLNSRTAYTRCLVLTN